jgi:hypothetical protein
MIENYDVKYHGTALTIKMHQSDLNVASDNVRHPGLQGNCRTILRIFTD